jgi:hypothetical protein
MEGSTADETWAMGNLEFRWEIPAVNGEWALDTLHFTGTNHALM